VRPGRAAARGPRPPSRRGGSQVGPEEPALERAGRGDEAVGRLHQLHADQPGAPRGMRAAQRDGVRGGWIRGGLGAGRRVVGGDAAGAPEAKSPDQAPDGHTRQAERLGDPGGSLPLLPELKGGATDRDGDRAWHGATSRGNGHETDTPVLYRRYRPIKLGVAISRSNFVSRDIFGPRCGA
jgi:hypothetical protein